MNINQYKCNMKVLITLFLANSIGLNGVKSGEDFVDFYDGNYDEKNRSIKMRLVISTRDRDISAQYFFRIKEISYADLIYIDVYLGYFKLRVFLK